MALDEKVFSWVSVQNAIAQFDGFKTGNPEDHIDFLKSNLPSRDLPNLAKKLVGDKVEFTSSNAPSSRLVINFINVFGAFHGRAFVSGFISGDQYPVVVMPNNKRTELVPVSQKSDTLFPGVSLLDLIKAGAKTVYLPVHPKREEYTAAQLYILDCINSHPEMFKLTQLGNTVLDFDEGICSADAIKVVLINKTLEFLPKKTASNLIDIDGVIFSLEELFEGKLTPISRFSSQFVLNTFSSLERSGSEFFFLYGVPAVVQAMYLIQNTASYISPKFKVSFLTGKVKVGYSNTSLAAIKTEYINLFKKLETSITTARARSLFGALANCVEYIEESNVWLYKNFASQVPRIDPYQEGTSILKIIEKFSVLEQSLESISPFERVERATTLNTIMRGVVERFSVLVAYAIELQSTEFLLVKQAELLKNESLNLIEIEELTKWDQLADNLLAVNSANDVATDYTRDLPTLLKQTSDQLNLRLSAFNELVS